MSFSQTSGRSLILFCLLVTAGCGMRSTVTSEADDPSLSQAGTAGGPLPEWDAGPVRDPDDFDPGVDTQNGEGPCGNGGTCNPENLGGENCRSLGAGRGQLACDPITCTFDLSMCSGGDGGGGGGTTGGNMGGGGTNGGGNGGFFGGGSGGDGAGGTNGGNNGGFFGGGGDMGGGGGTDGGGQAGGGFFGGGNMGGGQAGGGFFGGGNAGGGANNGAQPSN